MGDPDISVAFKAVRLSWSSTPKPLNRLLKHVKRRCNVLRQNKLK